MPNRDDGVCTLRVAPQTHGVHTQTYDPETRGLEITLGEPVEPEIRLSGVIESGLPQKTMAYLDNEVPTVNRGTSSEWAADHG